MVNAGSPRENTHQKHLEGRLLLALVLVQFSVPAWAGSDFASGFEDGEGPTYSIDFCRLQFPTLISEAQGTKVAVYARLYVAGLTDMSIVNDPAPQVIGYVGYGPDGGDPPAGWTWTEGMPNAGYGPASPGYEANNDEYQATLVVPTPPGAYDFAFRFSGDSGATFTYCDGGAAGSSDGYNPADAGQMTSLPDA